MSSYRRVYQAEAIWLLEKYADSNYNTLAKIMEQEKSPEEIRAEQEAIERGLSETDIARAKFSPAAGLGAVLQQKISNKGHSTEEFSEISGIPEDELRGIYFGLIETLALQDRFGLIAETLEMDDKTVKKFEKLFPFLED